jgi:hypothetical protein
MEVAWFIRSFSKKYDGILAALHATLAAARRVICISNVMALAKFHEFTLPRSVTAGDFFSRQPRYWPRVCRNWELLVSIARRLHRKDIKF